MNDITVIITGEAGQGLQTLGMVLCKIFKNSGFNIFANQDYMSRIRGGINFFQIRLAEEDINSLRNKADIIIALNKESYYLFNNELADDGIIITDKDHLKLDKLSSKTIHIPFFELSKKTTNDYKYINSIACGIICGYLQINFDNVIKNLNDYLKKYDKEIINKNIDCAKVGYDYSKEKSLILKNFTLKKSMNFNKNYILNGNEAIGLGAIKAGCKFYSAYPMTPSTGILNTLVKYSNQYNIIIEQAEDEIAAINMAIGASFAGARSMTGTSGGGFALMTEGLSLAGMTETPIVIAEVQRPGPATGLPTRTEQSDLNFLIFGGHGEFPRIIYTPGTIEECYYLTIKAFDMAEKYQIPVFILSDQHLADSIRNINKLDNNIINTRYIISKEKSESFKNYKRYELNKTGISPRAIPSWIDDVVYVDSDEHTEEGHITESSEVRNKMMEKRLFKKLEFLNREIEKPEIFNTENADIILAGFGSTYGVIKDTIDFFHKNNINLGYIHFKQICPFPVDEIKKIIHNETKLITVENNATAQLAKLIRRETGINIEHSILRYDGRPFNIDDLISQINERL